MQADWSGYKVSRLLHYEVFRLQLDCCPHYTFSGIKINPPVSKLTAPEPLSMLSS